MPPRRNRMTVGIERLVLLGSLIPAPLSAQIATASPDPDGARFITSDIRRFWAVVDEGTGTDLATRLDREYLAEGTAGLQEFREISIGSAEELAETIETRRERYEEIREMSMNVAAAERAIRAPLYALEYLYPDALFPDIYFVIGRLRSGGTARERGLFIGTEMFRDADGLRSIVAHELIHFQQLATGQYHAAAEAPSLLALAILEGSADFLAELISGIRGNRRAQEYGRAHESSLWEEFMAEMQGTNIDPWFYNDPPGDRPADLGYFVGYRIAEAYYERATDKRQAIREILSTTDFAALLEQSGYGR